MFRLISHISAESLSIEFFGPARKDTLNVFRSANYSSSIAGTKKTVLVSESTAQVKTSNKCPATANTSQNYGAQSLHTSTQTLNTSDTQCQAKGKGSHGAGSESGQNKGPKWPIAAALAVTASLSGVYFYRKLNEDEKKKLSVHIEVKPDDPISKLRHFTSYPASADKLPSQVDFLIVGSGTAAFSALRTLRSYDPDAKVLVVGEEHALPYMKPPLLKELWKEPDLATKALDPDTLTFEQWNGKRRSILYEPSAYYMPVEELETSEGGGSVARGWKVSHLDLENYSATLGPVQESADQKQTKKIKYTGIILAQPSRPRRLPSLASVSKSGRVFAPHSLVEVAAAATFLQQENVKNVVIVGGSYKACQISLAVKDMMRKSGREDVQVTMLSRSPVFSRALPPYLAKQLEREISDAGVTVLTNREITDSRADKSGLHLRVSKTHSKETEREQEDVEKPELAKSPDVAWIEASAVLECCGSEPDVDVARRAGLEIDDKFGTIVTTSELAARWSTFAAGDAAGYWVKGRRVGRSTHDHAVHSARKAAAHLSHATRRGSTDSLAPKPTPFAHQHMLWLDLPRTAIETVGDVDSSLETVGVFSSDAVTEVQKVLASSDSKPSEEATNGTTSTATATQLTPSTSQAEDKHYDSGVVFYLKEKRIVGILLWNLFNRIQTARQVLSVDEEFPDLLEVARLFSQQKEEEE